MYQPLKRLEKPITEENFLKRKVEDSILEAYLAKKLMEDGLIRNAAGKAFQAWKDLISALLMLKKDEVLKLLKDENQRKWFLEKGIYAPTTKLRALSSLLEDVGVRDVRIWTSEALDLHSYQYNGPDPEGVWGGLANEEEAKDSIMRLLKKLKEYVNEFFGELLDDELKRALEAI